MRQFLILTIIAGALACHRSPSKSFATGLAYFRDEDFGRAAACFEEAIQTGVSTAQAWNFLGVCRLQIGDTETAITAFQEALKLDTNYAAARYNLAAAFLEAKQPAQALPQLRQLTQAANCPPSVHRQLSRVYLQLGDWAKAKQALEKLPNLNTADIQNDFGVIETHLGNAKLAKTHFDLAARLDLQHAGAHQNLALLDQYFPPAKPTPATPPVVTPVKLPDSPALNPAPLQVLPVAEPAKPTPPAAPTVTPPPVVKRRLPVNVPALKAGDRVVARAFFNDGVAQQQQTKLPAAIAAYAKAVAADPTFAQAYYNLAIAHQTSNQPDLALNNYELALAAQTDFRDARFNYAILLQQQGFIVDALAQYEKILEINPNEPAVRLTAATLYARAPATRAKARQHYDAYLRLVPNSPMARDIRDWLEKNR